MLRALKSWPTTLTICAQKSTQEDFLDILVFRTRSKIIIRWTILTPAAMEEMQRRRRIWTPRVTSFRWKALVQVRRGIASSSVNVLTQHLRSMMAILLQSLTSKKHQKSLHLVWLQRTRWHRIKTVLWLERHLIRIISRRLDILMSKTINKKSPRQLKSINLKLTSWMWTTEMNNQMTRIGAVLMKINQRMAITTIKTTKTMLWR